MNSFQKFTIWKTKEAHLLVFTFLSLAIIGGYFLDSEISQSQAQTGNIINAISCSQTDVQNAINQAQSGDTVQVPAGNCTWSGTVSISGKNITVQGNGIGSTIITRSGTAFNLNTTNSRLTGFEFILPSGDSIAIARGQAFRIDNNKFINNTGASRVAVYSYGSSGVYHPTGVIDNNEFINSRVLIMGSIQLFTDGNGQDQHNLWREPSKIGNPDQTGVVYVEDNTFTRTIPGNSIDTNRGGRYVFRHNNVTMSSIEVHSLQSNVDRGSKNWEVYGNTFNAPSSFWTAMFIRGGTGVAYDNIIAGSYGSAIYLDNVRSLNGSCDGSDPIDGNQDSTGWPCRDQIGRATDNPGTYPQPQASEPSYFWNNTLNGITVDPVVINNSNVHIKAGRDYYNTPRPGYTAYIYPHPLAQGGTQPPPPPPAPPPSSPPSCTISFNPTSITSGGSTTLSWSSSNDSDNSLDYSCTGNIGSGFTNTSNGSATVLPTTSQTCTFTAQNSSGSDTCQATVTISSIQPTPPPQPTPTPTPSLTVTPTPTTTISPTPTITFTPPPAPQPPPPGPQGTIGTGVLDTFSLQKIPAILAGLSCYAVNGAIILVSIVVIYSGIRFFFVHGNATAYSQSKKAFLYVILGALIVFAVYTIIMTVMLYLGYTGPAFVPFTCTVPNQPPTTFPIQPPTTITCNQPIYNYYYPSPNNPPATDHYQPDFIDNNAISIGYQYNGIAFNILSAPIQGSIALYKCYSNSNGEHMLSTNSNCEGYNQNDGIAGYIMAVPTQNATVPLYRCYSPFAVDHYSTTNINECSAPSYSLELIQGYICN